MKHFILISLFLLTSFSLSGKSLIVDGVIPNFSLEQKGGEEKVMLYPNPAKYVTQVKVMENEVKVSQIAVYGILGNRVYEKSFSGQTKDISINVQNFKKGKYLVKVIFADGTSEVKALIKQ